MIDFYAWTGYGFWFIVCAFVFFCIGCAVYEAIHHWREKIDRNRMADFLNAHFTGEGTWNEITGDAEVAAGNAIDALMKKQVSTHREMAKVAILAYFKSFEADRKRSKP